jgi:phosphoadenosine phosphosulfate reductase
MLSHLDIPRPQTVDVIFLDTLHHFPETLDLVDRVRHRYPNVTVHVFRPAGVDSEAAFARKYGPRLWERDDQRYDWLAKVEPVGRAVRELHVTGLLTGRRRSQGGPRGSLDVLEMDDAGLIKINPLATWSWDQVQQYVRRENLPYNALLDRGYKSVGDYHSTAPVADGEPERAGRWKGLSKTECGIHNPRSKYAQYLRELERQQEEDGDTEAQSQPKSPTHSGAAVSVSEV